MPVNVTGITDFFVTGHAGRAQGILSQGKTGPPLEAHSMPTVKAKSGKTNPAAANGKTTSALLPIGHGNYAATTKLIAVLNSNSQPIKRMIHLAKKSKTLIDATHGRRSRSVLIMDNGQLVLSALNTDTMAQRFQTP